MYKWYLMLVAALGLGLAACGRGPAVAKPMAVAPEVGTLYSLSDNEGGFRAGKRHGYGQVVGADEKVQSGRWEDGKLVESAP